MMIKIFLFKDSASDRGSVSEKFTKCTSMRDGSHNQPKVYQDLGALYIRLADAAFARISKLRAIYDGKNDGKK